MSKSLLEKLNPSPVKSWSWLNINDVTIKDYEVPEEKPYIYDFMPNIDTDELIIENIKETKKSLLMFSRGEYAGVSEELLKKCEKENNTGILIHARTGYNKRDNVVVDYKLNKEQDFLIDNNLIIADEESELNVFIKYSSEGNEKGFHNGLTRVYGKRNSKIKLVKLQDFNENVLHLDSNFVKLEEGASIILVNIDSGGKQTVVNWNTELNGAGSAVQLKGVYIGDGNKKLDINYKMKHIGKSTKSTIDSKGALLDASSKTFKGTIDFIKGSSGSVGREEEFSMLLSSKAKAIAVPLMLCDEEDIEGSHAASAGKIDEEKLFYMMSRGFSELEAKKIIIEAAINPVLEYIEDETVLLEIRNKLGRRLLHG